MNPVLDQVSEPPSIGQAVTSFSGASFCISGANGDIDGRRPHGWFFRDRRLLCDLTLRLDGQVPEALSVWTPRASSAVFVARLTPDRGDSEATVLLERRRTVGRRLTEKLVLRNLSPRPRPVRVAVDVRADFADVFAVKESRVRDMRPTSIQAGPGVVTITRNDEMVRVRLAEAESSTDGLVIVALVPPHGRWDATLEVDSLPDEVVAPPAVRARTRPRPVLTDDAHFGPALRRSATDLVGLQIDDPQDPGSFATAAGAPWFMTLFGRDSLWTGLMTLPFDPTIARGTLSMLAARQGVEDVPETEEQPGRILHETRLIPEMPLVLGGGSTYYGTVDATLLFVVLLGEYARWTGDVDTVRAMLPHADAALGWAARDGDLDGDGFVEYERRTPHGLLNQGWKDSWNGVTFADGRLAEPPVALCEVQAYWYAALEARADIALMLGQSDVDHRRQASELRERFEATFWVEDPGFYALALDGSKQVVDSVTSNQGHVLWCGVASQERGVRVARLLAGPTMFSGWGVRTLATDMTAYNPLSYHNGSVWPHDSAIAVAGMARYGAAEATAQLSAGLLEASQIFDGRLPELFAGFSREEFPTPIPYPTSCSPQAWASAAPLLLLRAVLGLEPDLVRGEVRVDPVAWPSGAGLTASGLRLGSGRVSVSASSSGAVIEGLPDTVRVVHGTTNQEG